MPVDNTKGKPLLHAPCLPVGGMAAHVLAGTLPLMGSAAHRRAVTKLRLLAVDGRVISYATPALGLLQRLAQVLRLVGKPAC
jgi:hypothetical protein